MLVLYGILISSKRDVLERVQRRSAHWISNKHDGATSVTGDAENARNDIARPSKLWGLTTRDRTTRDQIAGTDIARKDIARPDSRD